MLVDSIISNKVDILILMTRDLSQEIQCQSDRIDSSYITISQITQNQAELNSTPLPIMVWGIVMLSLI